MDDFAVNPDETTRRITPTGKILYVVTPAANTPPSGTACVIRDMRHYWEGLRRNASVPFRAQVTREDMAGLLDHAFLVERLGPGMARFRLVGQHLMDLMGMELRGMPFCSLMNSASRKKVCHLTETVFRAPQIAEMQVTSPAAPNGPALSGTLLLLPLKSDLDDVSRALGCLMVHGGIGKAPRRFDLQRTKLEPIIPGGEIMQPWSLTHPTPG